MTPSAPFGHGDENPSSGDTSLTSDSNGSTDLFATTTDSQATSWVEDNVDTADATGTTEDLVSCVGLRPLTLLLLASELLLRNIRNLLRILAAPMKPKMISVPTLFCVLQLLCSIP